MPIEAHISIRTLSGHYHPRKATLSGHLSDIVFFEYSKTFKEKSKKKPPTGEGWLVIFNYGEIAAIRTRHR